MTRNDFDKIARIYDILASMIFGNAIRQSQQYHLHDLKPNCKILILGGGTGWLLKEIIAIHPQSEICYIEASEKMLRLSKKKMKMKQHHTMQFIHGTEEQIPPNAKFDFIITNFYLDLFTTESLDKVIKRITIHASPHCKWIATDFVDHKIWWQTLMLKVMYKFFHIVSNIEACSLGDWNKLLMQNNWSKKATASFYREFIESSVYKHYHTNEVS